MDALSRNVAVVILILLGLSTISRDMFAQELQEVKPERVDPEALAKILNDRELWGKDFPIVLAYLPIWKQVDEDEVAIFPNQVVSETRYKSRDEAGEKLTKMQQVALKRPPKPKPQFLKSVVAPTDEAPPFKIELNSKFKDDGLTRVAWIAPSLEFLPPDLTIAKVRKRLGKEEKITQQVIQTERDSRPVVLTLHHYASGAIIFVESDWNPKPGSVDRVRLDVAAVTIAVFEEPNL